MLRDVLFKYLEKKNSVDTGNLLAFYSFNSYSGLYNFNEKYVTPDKLEDGQYVDINRYPAIVYDSGSNFNTSGSGYFDSKTLLKIGESVDLDAWTIFINFYSEDRTNNRDKGRTIISSMDSPSQTSGFNIGINGSNRLYCEYVDDSGYLNTLTSDNELNKRNLVSVAKTSNSFEIEIGLHDYVNSLNHIKKFKITNATGINSTINSNAWYVGDFYSSSSNYTGFSGSIEDILIVSGFVEESIRNSVAQGFFATDYSGERVENKTFYYNKITGVTETEIQITGTGITGYELVCPYSNQTRGGDSVNICFYSGMTGQLSGQVDIFETGSETGSSVSGIFVPEKFFFDTGYLYKYMGNNIVFKEAIDEKDIFEVYMHPQLHENLNKEGEYVLGADYVNLGTSFSGENLNFFLNGVLQRSGTYSAGKISSGNYYITGIELKRMGENPNIDNNIYDKIDGLQIHTGYESGEAVWTITGNEYVSKDVYINGQKMISGLNYTGSNDEIHILRSTLDELPSGEVAFVPRKAYDNRTTGTNTIWINNNDSILSEQLWLNGVRQMKKINYFITDDDSLLNITSKAGRSKYNIYGNSNNFFNI
jgi:hypothetical protein